MACVVKRDGKWKIDYRDRNGVRHIETLRTREDAKARLAQRLGAIGKGTYVAPTALPTFGELASQWFSSKHAHRPASRASWQMHLKHLSPLDEMRLDRIDVTRVEVLRDELSKTKHLSPQTVNKVLTTATAVFKLAQRRGLLERNPGALAERLRQGASELTGDAVMTVAGRVRPEDVPSTDEVRKLIGAADAGRDRTLFLTGVVTGARVGELLALQWSDVALDTGKLTIRRSVSWARVKGDDTAVRARFFGPKTAAGNRTVDMPQQLRRALREWKLACPPSDQDLIFPGDDRRVWHRTTMTRRSYHEALRRAGLPLFNFHALRHFFASSMLASGAKVTEVAHVLGHSSPQVTLKVYAHWLRDEQTTAMQSVATAVCDTPLDAGYRRGVSGNRLVTEAGSEVVAVAVSS